ncbi:hypothetical protein QEZ40_002630 [Streptomyces katrae]|uniref:Uncharacterized protein n=1 Tax=Streptomyces katrae TaxID=68223 RepID=A0ABT7GVQ2_9ACTN|nr:hypothetical protein [Streptomyces katrae]MDK9497687.1 hypothetical protein [Streptomyces katrae]
MGRRHTDAETLVRRGTDGQLYMAAQEVTALLRDLAQAFGLQAATDGAARPDGRTTPLRLDGDTLRAVADVLEAQADALDVQLIAMSGPSAVRRDGSAA